MKKYLKIIFYKLYYHNKHVKISWSSNIGFGSKFEGYNVIHSNTSFTGYLGYGSYIGPKCNINGRIGRFCSIADDVQTIYAVHPAYSFVSTHPVFYSTLRQNGQTYVNRQKFQEFIFADEKNGYSVIIGNDVWIGSKVMIMGGVTIGDGAIIGTGSIVTRNVKPYSIVVGIPAKSIKNRFHEDEIEFLMKYRWWDKGTDWIKANADFFEDMEKFRDEFGDETVEDNHDSLK